MDMSKRAAVAISGLVLTGAAALALGATTPANASDFNGGGGGGTNQIYQPFQKFDPFQQNKAW